jgi:hypothetical protein
VLAPLVEQLGAATLLVYLALLGTIALAGLAIAARARTAERVLIGAGASLLLIAQWALIHGGTLGVLPLTGIVVPFVSSGKSSMVAFLVLVALLARLAHDGPPRAPSDELVELHRAARGLRIAVVSMLLLGAVLTVRAAAVGRDATTARTIRVRLRDGTVVQRANPRLLAVARAIRRGAITDRDGAPLAISSATARDYPLGDAMGTLLGVDPSPVQRPPWALEGLLDDRLRGYHTLGDLAPLVTRSPADRAAALRALDAAVADRSVALSIDAALQQELAALAAAQKGLAVAAVVIDVDTGQVLARVQRPDFAPPDIARATHGAYGSWPDKTGLQGMFQAGSVGKLFTALAAVRAGMPWHGTGCAARSDVRFACVDHDDQGPMFTRPGWPKPIHDHARDDNHGELELVGALAVSCNVYFGQLGLDIGGEPFAALRLAGADVGYPGGAYAPGPAGSRQLASTAFGQGATVMNVMQAARLVAALAAGGHYRRCPPTMELAAPCPDTPLLDDPSALAPILAGMALVMTDGTGKRLAPPKGVRVYGKTGTADVRGFAGEEPFGIARRATASPHSWFVAFAEPDSTPACALTAPRRLAIAVVVPRGGAGATAAGPLAMKILAAAQELGYL